MPRKKKATIAAPSLSKEPLAALKQAIVEDVPPVTVAPADQAAPAQPVNQPAIIPQELIPTGMIRKAFCGGYNFYLVKRREIPLTQEEKELLQEPLDNLEAEILKKLPEFLREQCEKSGALTGSIMQLAIAVILIRELRNQQIPAKKEPAPTPAPAAAADPATQGAQ